MTESNYIIHTLSDKLNRAELDFMENSQEHFDVYNGNYDPSVRLIEGQLEILPELQKVIPLHGKVLELGAGCCWFTSEISKLEAVSSVHALEMSRFAIEKEAPNYMRAMNARIDKITRVLGDFNQLQFGNQYFDFVVFDAALHHIPTQNFPNVMAEVARVLKDGGKAIAIREPFLPPVPLLKQIKRRRFGSFEKQHGITENSFTKKEWRALFQSTPLRCWFTVYGPTIKARDTLTRKIKRIILKTPLKHIFNALFNQDFFIVLEKR
jgi:ubiquinone/menaquinone biosynthesis C-methylase UbiE